jgi:hypothetical protein
VKKIYGSQKSFSPLLLVSMASLLFSCAGPATTPDSITVNPKANIEASLILTGMANEVTSLEVSVVPDSEVTAKVEGGGRRARELTLNPTTLTKRVRMGALGVQSIPVVPIINLAEGNHQITVRGLDQENGVVLYEATQFIQVRATKPTAKLGVQASSSDNKYG